jgi:ferredoxin--NADP+ reductase
MYKIVHKKKLNDLVEQITVEAPYVATRCQGGQFVIVSTGEDGERIPLTIQDYDREKNTVNLIYQVVGYSTAKLSEIEEGGNLDVCLGPLGQPVHFDTSRIKRVLGIGGGVGIAPLFLQMRCLKEAGVSVDVILGGRSAELVILKDEIQEFTDNIYFATNDGSLGRQGIVTDVLNDLLEKGEKYDLVICIGPVVMMKAVVGITKPLNIPTNVSLNPIMIDGTGMCGGCRVSINGEVKFACVDGPDFDGFEVDYDELIRRLSFYHEEEHICRLRGGEGK